MAATRAAQEVLVELTLLDADVTLPRDAYEAQAQAALGASQGVRNSTGASAGPRALGGAECTVLVMVSRAENLPTVLK